MKVLFLINSLGSGGAERSTAVLLPHLQRRGITPVVVEFDESPHGDDETNVRASGIAVHVVTAAGFVDQVRDVRALLDDHRPAILHTAITDADFVGRIASAGKSVTVISSLINTPYVPERRRDPSLRTWKVRGVQAIDAITGWMFVDRFHAVSQGVAATNARSLGIRAQKISVVHRGRDPEEIGHRTDSRRLRVRDSLDLDAATQVILAVGRQEFQKGYEVLIDAVDRLASSSPDIRLMIAGRPGNATGSLERALIDHPRARERTVVLGHRNDVHDLMAAADVLAISSHYEGTAGVALEAMALELPIVSTATTGVTGVLQHGVNCRTVPVGDAGGLADTLAETLHEFAETERIVARAKRDFLDRFTIERSADAMAEMYRTAVKANC